MPVSIVDSLEVIDIRYDNACAGTSARSPFQLLLQMSHDGASIPYAGQVIMRCLDMQPVM
jgi:hypothetical protein